MIYILLYFTFENHCFSSCISNKLSRIRPRDDATFTTNPKQRFSALSHTREILFILHVCDSPWQHERLFSACLELADGIYGSNESFKPVSQPT